MLILDIPNVSIPFGRCRHILHPSMGYKNTVKGKAISVTDHGGPLGYEISRLPRFLDNGLTDGGEVVSLMCQPPFTTKKIPGTISVKG
jgi:hypothetical protein